MNGRIERIDGRLELYSEPNYANIDFFFSEEKMRKWKRRATDALILGSMFGALCLITWGAARAL